jgi:uncharacterized protein
MTATVDCPTCGRKAAYDPSNRWRPFCSERCKMIDLGAWASDRYAIPGSEIEPDDAPTGDPAGGGEHRPRDRH